MVVCLRFGLDGDQPLTLQEVGRRLGVTREWVRKIELRAVKKLDDRGGWWPTPASTRRTTRAIAPAAPLAQTA